MLNVRLRAAMKLEASPACVAQLGNIAICHFVFSNPTLWLAETLNCSSSLQKQAVESHMTSHFPNLVL